MPFLQPLLLNKPSMPLKVQDCTLFALLFFRDNLLRRYSLWRFLIGAFLCQDRRRRLQYFNFLCCLEGLSLKYFSLKYYFTKRVRGYFHRLAFFSVKWRCLLIPWEWLYQDIARPPFAFDFFYYSGDTLYNPFILPFKHYLLRLDLYSFFLLFTGLEGIRLTLYNNYIRTHPALVERNDLKYCLIQTWFPKRRSYVPLRGLNLLHVSVLEKTSLRQRLAFRFSMMLFHKKYIILNLFQLKTLIFTRCPRPLMPQAEVLVLLKQDSNFFWLTALSGVKLESSLGPIQQGVVGLMAPWIWSQCCHLYFLYFMRYAKRFRYSMELWGISRYSHYLMKLLFKHVDSSHGFVQQSLLLYVWRFTKTLYRNFYLSWYWQYASLIQDLYIYSHFSWDAFGSFIDRHFCYRVISMKFNWFFDLYYLNSHLSYIGVTFNLLRPFSHKPTPNCRVPRRRTLFFAKRFLLRFCSLPLFFSYTLLGLEYFYWRILELSSSGWQHVLPMAYYYTKLDIDRLLLSRYRSMVDMLQISKSFPSLYKQENPSFTDRSSWLFHGGRWSVVRSGSSLNPWILLSFMALQSIFLQSLNSTLELTLIAFFLLKEGSLFKLGNLWGDMFFFRSCACLDSVLIIHSFLLIDLRTSIHVQPLWDAPRAKKWLAYFDKSKPSTLLREPRYGLGYTWLRVVKQNIDSPGHTWLREAKKNEAKGNIDSPGHTWLREAKKNEAKGNIFSPAHTWLREAKKNEAKGNSV